MSDMSTQNGQVLLDIKNLKKYFAIQKGSLQRATGYLRAVDDVSLFIEEGETLGLVGESGCGKTTTARCILRVLEPTAGHILLRVGPEKMVDLAALSRSEVRPLRRHMQMVFQDPFTSLNPRMTLFDIVGEPLLVHGMRNRKERHDRVAELLGKVGLRPEYMSRYPHAFSGGQRQRISVARALSINPRLVVADEPTSSLDVSVQAQILNLMMELQDQYGLTYLFVTHDLSVVRHICDRVAVMYVGKIVEMVRTRQLFSAPRHPYTEALLSAVPKPDPRLRSERILLKGDVANPADPPSGCYFHPRCQYANDRCRTEAPTLTPVEPGHFVSCHRAAEISLRGIDS
jgi:peptide/nickel transport system ATP-binding protein